MALDTHFKSRKDIKKSSKHDRYLSWFMIIPALAVVVVLIVVPMIYSFSLSLTNMNLLKPATTQYIGFRNYMRLFHDDIFWRAFWNTVIFMTVAVNVEFILGLFIAQLMFKVTRGQGVIRTAIMVP